VWRSSTKTRPRKALESSPDLSLYALAQVRADDVREACKGTCADCPGPEAEDGCLTRKYPALVAGRSDWPMCPQGMLRVRTWQECVDLYVAAKVSPIGHPEGRPAFVQDALVSLFAAVRVDDERRAKEAQKGPAAGPKFTGRRVARGT